MRSILILLMAAFGWLATDWGPLPEPRARPSLIALLLLTSIAMLAALPARLPLAAGMARPSGSPRRVLALLTLAASGLLAGPLEGWGALLLTPAVGLALLLVDLASARGETDRVLRVCAALLLAPPAVLLTVSASAATVMPGLGPTNS